ncbi:MAG: nicotinate (nicotinamide) nucleotide adenylyltransferase [Bacilli bacterium]|nr:nicotinate (nicotinamide) nucleotide adenylyltransferase [Bacilli bacterium]
MRLGIYVGSFNPVHNGHIKVVNYLIEKDYVDKVLLLPTPSYWDKQDLAPMQDRIHMLKYFENEKIEVDTIHNNYEYTYEVFRSLKKDYPNDELYLIIGSDNIEKFHLWQHVEELLENKIIVVKRDETKVEDYTKKFDTNNFIIVKEFIPIEESSTNIRKNKDTSNLDKRVLQYITDNKIYK